MSDYVPMRGPLPGKQYVPSNGTEGYCFMEGWCCKCARDRAMREGVELDECDDDEKCEIIAASFRGEAVEWRELDSGETTCLAFVAAGQEPPPPRCEHTPDMFGFGTNSPPNAALSGPNRRNRPAPDATADPAG